PERIEDLEKPFLAVATDLSSGREVWFRDGSLVEAIRASISIPGVFSPSAVNDRWMLDGGLVNPVPVSGCRVFGASRVLAVNPNAKDGALWKAPDQSPTLVDRLGLELPAALRELLPSSERQAQPGYADVVSVSIDIMTEFILKHRAAADPPDVLLSARLQHMSVLELHRAAQAIEEGVRITRDAEADIRAL
ncbi:MAG: patatin-like phospholipase family protein, partial [Pseudomonadota bacterium]